MLQTSTLAGDAANNALAARIGAAATLVILTGAAEANTAAADSGTLICVMNLPASPFAASSARVMTFSGTWSGVVGAGVSNLAPGHFRIKSGGTTPEAQGTAGVAATVATSAATAAHGNVLTFASPPSTVVGARLSGTGIPAGTTVESISGNTLVMSQTTTTGVASGASITIDYDMNLSAASVSTGVTLTVTSFAITEGNA